MKKILMLLFLLLPTLVVAADDPDENGYVAVAAVVVDYKDSSASFTNTNMGLKVGYNKDMFGVEGMMTGNVTSSSFYVGSTYYTAQVQSLNGAWIKLRTPGEVSFYVKGGLAGGTASSSSRWTSTWLSGTSFSYGAGMEAAFDDLFVQVDGTSYYNKLGITVKGLSASVGLKF